MKLHKLFLLLVLSINCSQEKPQQLEQKADKKIEIEEVKEVSYSEFLNQMKAKSSNEKKDYFFTYINTEIPNYWQGTPWTFNGTTKEPGKGSIACGYFVTHVLKDYGFDINTVYLAQQPSSVMIKKLCTDIQYFTSVKDLENYILSQDDHQVYIVGLDFHTGFIARDNQDTYFIHSNYIKNKGVVKEKTSESQALNASKTFMLGRLKY